MILRQVITWATQYSVWMWKFKLRVKVSEWVSGRVGGWVTDWLTNWLTKWLAEWLSHDWLTDWQLRNQKFTLHEKPPHIYDHPEKWPYQRGSTLHGPLTRYVKLRVAHAPGIPWTFSPPPQVSDPDMHYGTCVTHVPLCMPGSLTSGFLWSRWRGKRSRHSWRMRNPQFYVSGKKPMMKYLS